ncbi:MAG TPA: efflux RND transporter periplasmic adaptor subunit [Gemmatimonadales bacterium]|nr:efflux RND transporter periplasmic adaptor subunit [Gemmatimonadales bacterium]
MLSFVAGCGGEKAPPPPPPPTVNVLAIAPRTVPAVFEFTAQAEASHRVEVRSLVQGTILARYFTEGSEVRKGQKLYLIDPAPYQAASSSSSAVQVSARATYEQSKRDLARGEALFKGGAISQRDFDVLRTNFERAEADLAGSAASLDKANVDLNRTTIAAEIDGRIGAAEQLVGAQVPGPSVLLTTIDQLDPIFVDLAISDNDRVRHEENVRTGRITPPANGSYRVQLVLSDSSTYDYEGRINFADMRIDQETGSLRLRTEFRNPKRRILPGQFVRARLLGATRNDAVLVPQTAVQQALGRQFVYVVVGDTAKSRDVVTGSWVGQDWIIEKGLQAGDKVIVDNLQRVRPGSPVLAKAWQPDSANAGKQTASAGETKR